MRCNGVICRLKGEIDGEKFDVGPIKASEGEKITAWTGYEVREWEGKLTNSDPLAARALLALFQFRSGTLAKFSAIEIDDLDSVDFDLYDPAGRVVSIDVDDEGKPKVNSKGQPIFLFDGEPLDPPTAAGSQTG